MAQLPGLQVYTGGNVVSGDTSFTSTTGARAHGVTPGTVANPPTSTFYLTSSLRDLGVGPLENLTVGIGLTAPFGLLISYPTSGPLAEVATRASLPLLDIKPTAAYRLTPYLSVGAGLDIYTFSDLIGDGQAEQKRIAGPEFALVGIPPGSVLEVNGIDTAVGFNVSILVSPLRNADDKPRLNVGLVYRSPVTLACEVTSGRQRADCSEDAARAALGLDGGGCRGPCATAARVEARSGRGLRRLELLRNLDARPASGVTLPSPRSGRRATS